MSSNFQKVVDFNHQFGVLESQTLKPNLSFLTEKSQETEFCLKLIREEMKELESAVTQNDLPETIDALGDILYVVYGMGARMGVDLDYVFGKIHKNNMEKMCENEEIAKTTVELYKNVSGDVYDTPNYRLAPNGTNFVVYNESTKKILKSIDWKPLDFSKILKDLTN